jgi:protein SCO1/2
MNIKARHSALVASVALTLLATSAYAEPGDRTDPLPKELEGVGITEKLGNYIPKDLGFTDSDGNAVKLGDFLRDKPVIFTMNYSSCPMLCSLQLNGFVSTLREMGELATKFDIVTVSLDPNETPQRAGETKARYVKDYAKHGDPLKGEEVTIDRGKEIEAQSGWHFLVGSDENVHALANALGFGYNYNPARKEYMHVAALMLVSPQGKVTRYMYGLQHSPQTLRLSLVEAADGKTGSALDKIVLYCFHYDAAAGKYGPVATNVMRVGGGITVVLLGAFLGLMVLRERQKRHIARALGNQSQGTGTAAKTVAHEGGR